MNSAVDSWCDPSVCFDSMGSVSTPKLPKSLEHEPLLEASFEARLGSNASFADILPGFLLHNLEPIPVVARLPTAEIPPTMRANDQNLRFMPTFRLAWKEYSILIGDRNIVISCKLPYPGWQKFKNIIVDVMERTSQANIDAKVERYSIRYVNIIEAPTPLEQIKKINIGIKLGDIEMKSSGIFLRVHHVENDFVHFFSVTTGAKGKLPNGRMVGGMVVDIDSVCSMDNSPDFTSFLKEFPQNLEKLKQANKAKFFNCLAESTLNEMEPVYE